LSLYLRRKNTEAKFYNEEEFCKFGRGSVTLNDDESTRPSVDDITIHC
jgi:hypothetical protein